MAELSKHVLIAFPDETRRQMLETLLEEGDFPVEELRTFANSLARPFAYDDAMMSFFVEKEDVTQCDIFLAHAHSLGLITRYVIQGLESHEKAQRVYVTLTLTPQEVEDLKQPAQAREECIDVFATCIIRTWLQTVYKPFQAVCLKL